jgi:hypothetical protein
MNLDLIEKIVIVISIIVIIIASSFLIGYIAIN